MRKTLRTIRSGLATRVENIRYEVSDKRQPDVLYAFYDLAVSPATFDIVVFLLLAELEREQSGCSSLHIVIVPGPHDGFRVDGAPYSTDDKRWRLRNILVPCCWLIPACQNVTVSTSRREARAMQTFLAKRIFPKGYTVSSPVEQYGYSHLAVASSRGAAVPSIQAPPQARLFMKAWIQLNAGNRQVITITLRESSYELDRNSSLHDWSEFARSLDPTVYCPVLIRDVEAAFKPLPAELDGLLICDEVVWNIELRAALYELSYLNMGISNGPCGLFVFNQRSRYLWFKMITPSCGATTEQHLRSVGIEPGRQLEIATRFQRIVWHDDDVHVMKEAFRDMSSLLHGGVQ